jgi:two-component system chemotaxis sensor kinase CheA
MSDPADKGRTDFLTEAEEIIEGLGRDLVLLDESLRSGAADPDLLNDLFRGVHTLKGLAGLFGATHLGALSHELEAKLDAMRMGRAAMTNAALDPIFRALDIYHRLLLAEKDESPPPLRELDELLVQLRGGAPSAAEAGGAEDLELDASIYAVLTEYEEHRLRVNVSSGFRVYRLRVRFSLLTIDESLERLKTVAKPHGEIITYLPTGEGDADSIELDILMASRKSYDELVEHFSALGASVSEVARRGGARRPSAHPSVVPGAALPASEPGEELAHALVSPSRTPPRPGSSIPPPFDPRGVATVRSVTQTVRVDIGKLDRLMNAVSELAIVKSSIDRLFDRIRPTGVDRGTAGEIVRLSRTFDRQLEAMQQGILEVRMVPLGQLFERLSRVARQVGRDAGKQFNLVITGAETEVDKLIVEELSDPLMHMMRNAIDHGIESSEGRTGQGKLPMGTIALNAFQKGNHVVIELEDDGAGIDTERVLEIALAKGLINPADVRSTSRREVLGLIFLPGLSTRDQASELSGRGVGMDVVKTNISKLGGVIDVQSEVGIGTKFTITLPITLAIIRVLLVQVEGQTFAIPLANVREAVTLNEAEVFNVDDHEAMTLRGTSLRLARLSHLFDLGQGRRHGVAGSRRFVVVTAAGANRLGLVVDRLVGGQDVVMKALSPSLRGVRGFAGAAELGDQKLGLVIDTPSVVEEVTSTERRRVSVGRLI